MNKTKKALKKLDVFGKDFKLNPQKKQQSYKTVLGGCCTIIGSVITLLISASFIQKLLDYSSPVVSVNVIKRQKPPRLNLNEMDTGQTFILFDGKEFVNYNKSKKFLTMKSFMATSNITSSTNTNNQQVSNITKIETTRCEEATQEVTRRLYKVGVEQTATDVNYRAVFGASAMCPNYKPDVWWIQGSKYKSPFRRSLIKVYPCSLPDPSQCATPEMLMNSILLTVLLTKTATYNKKTEPLNPKVDSDVTFRFGIGTNMKVTYYLQKNTIWDTYLGSSGFEHKFTFVDVDRVTTTTGTRLTQALHCTEAQIDADLCEPYMILEYQSSGNEIEIKRYYKKLMGTISEIGGFWDLIFIVIWFPVGFWNAWRYKKWLNHQVHQIQQQKDDLDNHEFQRNSKEDGVGLSDLSQLQSRGDWVDSSKFSNLLNFENLLKNSSKSGILIRIITMSLKISEQKAEYFVQRIVTNKTILKAKHKRLDKKGNRQNTQTNFWMKRIKTTKDLKEFISKIVCQKFPPRIEEEKRIANNKIRAQVEKFGLSQESLPREDASSLKRSQVAQESKIGSRKELERRGEEPELKAAPALAPSKKNKTSKIKLFKSISRTQKKKIQFRRSRQGFKFQYRNKFGGQNNTKKILGQKPDL